MKKGYVLFLRPSKYPCQSFPHLSAGCLDLRKPLFPNKNLAAEEKSKQTLNQFS